MSLQPERSGRRPISDSWRESSARYTGATPASDWWTRPAILEIIRWRTGNSCRPSCSSSSIRPGIVVVPVVVVLMIAIVLISTDFEKLTFVRSFPFPSLLFLLSPRLLLSPSIFFSLFFVYSHSCIRPRLGGIWESGSGRSLRRRKTFGAFRGCWAEKVLAMRAILLHVHEICTALKRDYSWVFSFRLNVFGDERQSTSADGIVLRFCHPAANVTKYLFCVFKIEFDCFAGQLGLGHSGWR